MTTGASSASVQQDAGAGWTATPRSPEQAVETCAGGATHDGGGADGGAVYSWLTRWGEFWRQRDTVLHGTQGSSSLRWRSPAALRLSRVDNWVSTAAEHRYRLVAQVGQEQGGRTRSG